MFFSELRLWGHSRVLKKILNSSFVIQQFKKPDQVWPQLSWLASVTLQAGADFDLDIYEECLFELSNKTIPVISFTSEKHERQYAPGASCHDLMLRQLYCDFMDLDFSAMFLVICWPKKLGGFSNICLSPWAVKMARKSSFEIDMAMLWNFTLIFMQYYDFMVLQEKLTIALLYYKLDKILAKQHWYCSLW